MGAYTSWQPEDIVTGGRPGLRWFRPDGSGLRWIKKHDEPKGFGYSYPSLIPGGRWLLYNAAEAEGAGATRLSLHLASLDGKVDRQLLTAEHPAIYTGPGYLLYRRGDTLMAQAIDPKNGNLRGGPTAVANSIGITAGIVDQLGCFSASDPGAPGGMADYSDRSLAPDGNRRAIGIRDPETGKRDLLMTLPDSSRQGLARNRNQR